MKKIIRVNGTIEKDHPDLKLLLDTCDCEDYLGSSMGSTNEISYEGHYLKIRTLKYWSEDSIQIYTNWFSEVNEKTEQFDFQILGFDDYEMEFDRDRSYDASISFIAQRKDKRKMFKR